MMTVCACLWLGLFPLLQFGTYSTITSNKWAIMLLLACFTLVCFIWRKPREKLPRSESGFLRPPVLIASALAFWILISCFNSPYTPVIWLIGASYRLEGLISQLCYLALFFLFAFSRVRRKPILLSAAAGVSVFFVVVILQRAGYNPFGLYPGGLRFEGAMEFQGTIGNIDMDNGYLCLTAALFMTEIADTVAAAVRKAYRSWLLSRHPERVQPQDGKSGRKAARPKRQPAPPPPPPAQRRKACFRRIACLSALLAAFALDVYLIISMDVQFGMITLAALGAITLFRFLPVKLRLPVLIFLVVLVLAVVWFWPGQSGGIWELKEIFHGRTQLSFGSNRVAVWKYSLMLAPQRLMTGGGPDTFTIRFNQFIRNNHLVIPTSQGKQPLPDSFDNPHNEYIAQLINHGLPAMLLFTGLIAAAAFFRRYRKKPPVSGSAARKSAGRKPVVRKANDPQDTPADRLRTLTPWAVAVLCYAVQAFFSFSVSMVAPMFWVVMGISSGRGD